jgi:hypothetical protein
MLRGSLEGFALEQGLLQDWLEIGAEVSVVVLLSPLVPCLALLVDLEGIIQIVLIDSPIGVPHP